MAAYVQVHVEHPMKALVHLLCPGPASVVVCAYLLYTVAFAFRTLPAIDKAQTVGIEATMALYALCSIVTSENGACLFNLVNALIQCAYLPP